MIDSLATKLPLEFLDRLAEYTEAKARQAYILPKEVTPKAWQRLIGHARQDAVQEAFRMAATAAGLSVSDFSPQRGMPSRYVLDFGEFNLVALKNQGGRSSINQECKALAMIADERLSGGSEVVDLFSGKRIIDANKPLYAWSAIWKGSPSKGFAQPTWTGFCALESSGTKSIRVHGTALGAADVRAAIIEQQTPAKKAGKSRKFTPRIVRKGEFKDKKKD